MKQRIVEFELGSLRYDEGKMRFPSMQDAVSWANQHGWVAKEITVIKYTGAPFSLFPSFRATRFALLCDQK